MQTAITKSAVMMDVADNVVSVVLVRSAVMLGNARPSCVQRILTVPSVVSVT